MFAKCLIFASLLWLMASPAWGQGKKKELPEEIQTALQKAPNITLYSVEPTRVKEGDNIQGWKVLGKTELKAEARKAVVKQLLDSVAEGKEGARCFIPRHAIRVTHDGKTFDLVICFECNWVYAWVGDKRHQATCTKGPEVSWNKILTDAGVKLPVPAK
jgi:hypothetical protein